MGKVAAARKLAAAAAYGGGGLSMLGASLYGVLRTEAHLARRTIGRMSDDWPSATGWYATHRPGPAIRIALLGDSSAVGYGLTRVEDTPGARLAAGVAAASLRRVHLNSVAVVGAQTSDLDTQIDQALVYEPHVAVILIGVNDVTHTVLPAQSVGLLSQGVRRLKERGVQVVVGTCPDLGTIEPFAPPLKQIARAWSRRLAAAQTIAVVEAGGRSVSLASILGPAFSERPHHMFGPDRFHPSATGYARVVAALLPTTLVALGIIPDEPVAGADRVLSLSDAAVEAARVPGTEVEMADLGSGKRGRWVLLRRRRREAEGTVEAPEQVLAGDGPA
jgi:lysophospholipase L1-like esterase